MRALKLIKLTLRATLSNKCALAHTLDERKKKLISIKRSNEGESQRIDIVAHICSLLTNQANETSKRMNIQL